MKIYSRYGLDARNKESYCDQPGFPAQSSVLDEEALCHRVLKHYDIPEVETCRFLSRGDSDIYRVTTAGQRLYLKVYRPPYVRVQVEAEASFVNDLSKLGLPVVRPVSRVDGNFATEVKAPEGNRPVLLFEEAPPPLPSLVDEVICEKTGRAVAQLHEKADQLSAEYSLRIFDCERIFDKMMPYTKPFLKVEDYKYLEALSANVRQRLEEIPKELPAWGLCHADLVLSNVRYHRDEIITLFDFGNAAYTWRAYELAVLHWSIGHRNGKEQQKLWDTFLSGYASVRDLPQGIRELLPFFLILRQIMFLSGNCATLPLRLGTEPFEGDFLTKGIAFVRQIAEGMPAFNETKKENN